jgi:hypothetical protein
MLFLSTLNWLGNNYYDFYRGFFFAIGVSG